MRDETYTPGGRAVVNGGRRDRAGAEARKLGQGSRRWALGGM